MTRTIYIFERGILGWQSIFGDWKNWPNQSVAWIHNNTPHKAQTLTYFIGFILPALTRHWRAKQFAKLLKAYAGKDWRIVLVAHSEGTATGLMAMRLAGYPHIEELHLICGAANSDCQRNKLNHAVQLDRVGKIFIYVAGQDMAMNLEDTYVGSACFGLQCGGTPMGLNGPTMQTDACEAKTKIIRWKYYGHSTCWDANCFAQTMRTITASIGY